MLVKQGARIGDVEVWVVVDLDITVGVKDSGTTSGCDGGFGRGGIAGEGRAASGRVRVDGRVGVVDGDASGVVGGGVGGYVQRPAVGSDGLWRGRD